ncbi:MAG TPA: alpha-amylase family glycosyl hydrolase [Kiritimatiellia bacterium]|nr:alpha-amylase family glycosyl hydrolase [Kiritimatiellia bacterium]
MKATSNPHSNTWRDALPASLTLRRPGSRGRPTDLTRNPPPHRPFTSTCLTLLIAVITALPASAEVILQYFNMPWRDLADKMPELAEVGYGALWLPPPTKASGGASVGYDLWDPFDLGGKDQRNTIRTRYGTEEDLLHLIRVAHRFGLRVYFDNIMNHRAFDIPGFNENTPIDIYPGMLPEDFHLRVTPEGFYRKWDNVSNWEDQWQVQHRNFSDLIDIAHETPNQNFGPNEGDWHPKISFVRHPNNPEYYAYDPNGNYIGYGNVTQDMLDNHPWAYTEDVGAYLMRAVRWLMDRTKADGLRLDAVKHVPSFFFGVQSGPDMDSSSLGYTGQVQLQFNKTRGFSDWNHRDTVFDTEKPRDDAMIFGEHLGAPPSFDEYISAGMRLVDAPLHKLLNDILGNPSASLAGLDIKGFSGNPAFNHATGVMFAQSHDDDFYNRRELQHALYLTRAGLPNIYTDGYFEAETLGGSGGAFPRHAKNPFLGQFGDVRTPNLVYIHNHFARGDQIPRWSDADVVAYERRDTRNEGWGSIPMSDADAAVMLFMMNDNYADGQARPIVSAFPSDAYLYNYSSYGGGFYTYAGTIANSEVIIPPGGYFVFSWRSPEPSRLWRAAPPLMIYQNETIVTDRVAVIRRDGPNGDPAFNPYNLPNRGYPTNVVPEPFTYRIELPRVTSATNLRFTARTDGSAINVLMKLNGGIDLNSHLGLGNLTDPGRRDYPPAWSHDGFLGWEFTRFLTRVWPEKFAAEDTVRCEIGSLGAEAYSFTVGQAGHPISQSTAVNDFASPDTVSWIWHRPWVNQDGPRSGFAQFWPPPANATTSLVYIAAKTPKIPGNELWAYYTTDGLTWPEGAAGVPANPATKVIQGNWVGDGSGGDTDWWEVILPPMPSNTLVRYKLGVFRRQTGGGFEAVFPNSPNNVYRKNNMMGVWSISNFNAHTIAYYPHNDWADSTITTGLVEGFHFIQARAFLERSNRAPIYNTFNQTFYLDTQPPEGTIIFPPTEGAPIGNQDYGVVVRADPTVTEVWYNILDNTPLNDDAHTGLPLGNGTNALGQTAWVRATPVTPSLDIDSPYPLEWRFTYRNVPPSGAATLRVLLREITSSTNLTLTPAQGHFTILERNVTTLAPPTPFFFDWPVTDGTVVQEGWTLRVHFGRSLGDGLNDQALLDRFLVTINGQPQGKALYRITRDIGGNLGQLEFDFPNLFNGDPDFLHQIDVTHQTTFGLELKTTRLVKAQPVSAGPYVRILEPAPFGPDGNPNLILLPDVPAPTPEQRQTPITVQTDLDATNLWITFTGLPGTATLASPPATSGNFKEWPFLWTNLAAGFYTFEARVDTDGDTNTVEALDTRSIEVRFRQQVDPNPLLDDDDHDGLRDTEETQPTPLPGGNSEAWTNGDVHLHLITGRSDPLSPDTDSDGLPDGLELGLGSPIASDTDPATDTNGNGWPNFLPDADPPVFNTTDNWQHPRYNLNRSRLDQLSGSMTDPAKADTDNDGLIDSLEDLNRNGRVDVGLLSPAGVVTNILRGWDRNNPSAPYLPTLYNTSRLDRDALPANARLLETDPNNPDTDGDGLLDGHEDANRNGRVDMLLLYPEGTTTVFNITAHPEYLLGMDAASISALAGLGQTNIASRAINYTKLFEDFGRPRFDPDTQNWTATNQWPRILFLETDPLNPDTNRDGLPDGWKVAHGLDPWDDGWYNLRTGQIHPTNSHQGADGDLTGDGFTNRDHLLNGTDPREPVFIAPPGAPLVIGPGPEIGIVNGIARHREFMDWTWDDLLALDPYQGAGFNNQQGDIYRAWDGWDSSRDLVAFYARDGGPTNAGGDGRFYFRFDLHDLQPFAEEANLDLYIVIDIGNPAIGERLLPDEVDTLTDMRWNAVVAIYNSSFGRVYVDEDPFNNTSTFGQSLTANGVTARTNDFLGAYFNSQLDAVEIAINRQALLDAGWNGADPRRLNYQVFSTKSGTCNTCVSGGPGAGDIGGRSDIRDSIRNDFIAEDHGDAQPSLQGSGSVLTQWIPGASRPGRIKVAKVIHGNQAIQPGTTIHNLINNGAGAGYFRPLDAHAVYQAPLNLHITPTLASAIQWAEADPALNTPWRDGPSFNARIRDLAATHIVRLLASTFSDHMLPYFTTPFNQDNLDLANHYLHHIYGVTITTNSIFWTPERLLDPVAFTAIRDLGFRSTLLDQHQHLWQWFGRQSALGNDGYRINRIHDIDTFAINNQANSFRFQSHDGGPSMTLRGLFNRRARSGIQDQVIVLMSHWEEFSDAPSAAAHDALVRWSANRPWVELVALEDITTGLVDLDGDGSGNVWGRVERGAPSLPRMAHDWVHYASRENYDHWFFGEAGFREGLAGKIFPIRPGLDVDRPWHDAFSNAWDAIQSISDPGLARLARGTAHASVFQTAFHNQETADLRKFSTGAYINPDTVFRSLAGFARIPQSQTRLAALFARVDQWAAAAPSITGVHLEAADLDFDGEHEYLLYNDRLLAIFQPTGGRMIGAWVRDLLDNRVYMALGNPLSYAGLDSEEEGNTHHHPDGSVNARRTTGLKDWWVGTNLYVNARYDFTDWTNGWHITSFNNRIRKTVTLQPRASHFDIHYTLAAELVGRPMFIRHGFTPHLDDLLLRGQTTLSPERHHDGRMWIENTNYATTVRAFIDYRRDDNTAGFNLLARDDTPSLGVTNTTRPMRNHAHTHQVELVGTNDFRFAIGFQAFPSDWTGDGLPNLWTDQYLIGQTPDTGPHDDPDHDGFTNLEEWIANTRPLDGDDFLSLLETETTPLGILVRYPTSPSRHYFLSYTDHDLAHDPLWTPINHLGFPGTGGLAEWLDDGTLTTPHPFPSPARPYRVRAALP